MKNNSEPPIIFAPQAQPKKERMAAGIFKFVLTSLLFILAFILTVSLWIGSGWYLARNLFTQLQFERTVNLMVTLFWIGLGVFLAMLFWQQYNLRIFGKKNYRKYPEPIKLEELGGLFGIAASEVEVLQRMKTANFSIEQGQRVICSEEMICYAVASPEEQARKSGK